MSIWRISLQAAVAGFTYQFSHSILVTALVFLLIHSGVNFMQAAPHIESWHMTSRETPAEGKVQ